MMKRVIAVALTAGAVAGCAHNTAKPPAAKLLRPASVSPSAALTAPAPAAGLDWVMTADGDQAKLAYGAAGSDDVRLVITCAKGSGKVSIRRTLSADQAGSPAVLKRGAAEGLLLAFL